MTTMMLIASNLGNEVEKLVLMIITQNLLFESWTSLTVSPLSFFYSKLTCFWIEILPCIILRIQNKFFQLSQNQLYNPDIPRTKFVQTVTINNISHFLKEFIVATNTILLVTLKFHCQAQSSGKNICIFYSKLALLIIVLPYTCNKITHCIYVKDDSVSSE